MIPERKQKYDPPARYAARAAGSIFTLPVLAHRAIDPEAKVSSVTLKCLGLQIPAHLLPTVASARNSDEEDDYAPPLPPDLTASHAAGPSLPSKSESNTYTPPPKRHYPQPLPTAYASQIEGKSGVEEFLEREESSGRDEQAEKASAGRVDACTSKKWRLVGIDASGKIATSCYEVAGRKRRAANTPPEEDSRATAKRGRRDEDICRGVEEHTRKARGSALIELHLERERRKRSTSRVNPPFPGNDVSRWTAYGRSTEAEDASGCQRTRRAFR
ncbi:uncharacterized protein HD556DRAFT_1451431 [Suillus plorans]|uniref:Uncharacterized protein n=1 Tax=Suillus plorans TaxID=116603 RepID=A0A9P7A975_9AGAM|nr:uncharacterized protein HD556DRAFT_1451431 [Suillus plorans]KAG1784747.1 hypothetical protein HD556DRAFT_1451431 [Suillus plorans]